jgi:hypothetical protein
MKSNLAKIKLRAAQPGLDSGYYNLLCALLAHAPSPEGVENIASEILSTPPEKFGDLARFYLFGLLTPCEKSMLS